MTGAELFETWAPASAVWSPWAKPVLFADLDQMQDHQIPDQAPAEPMTGVPAGDVSGMVDPTTAVIVDLPGPESVLTGLALARQGYRPVPLFNNAFHPAAVVNVGPILRLLADGADAVRGLSLEAPPAFLLDADRMTTNGPLTPGRFDNRWMVFPQDLPSASFLLSRHLHRAAVLHRHPDGQPFEDLTHVLLRWQEAGLEIVALNPDTGGPPQPLHLRKPSRFRRLWYRALAVARLRRNSAGGFGMIVPDPNQGGHG